MADTTNGWIVQPNPDAQYEHTVQTTDADGNQVEETVTDFGEPQWAYRRPGDHLMVFSGVSADSSAPNQTPAEHLAGTDYTEPQPDSVIAANELQTQQAPAE